MPPFFTTLHPMTPIFAVSIKIFSDIIKFWKILQIAAKISLKIVKIAQILCNFTPNDPPFSDLSPNDPLFCKKIVTDSPLIWCVGRRTPVIFNSDPLERHIPVCLTMWVPTPPPGYLLPDERSPETELRLFVNQRLKAGWSYLHV